MPILGQVGWCLLHSVLEFCIISRICSWKVIASTEMWMPEFQGPTPNKLEPHLTIMLNIQTQWAVPPEETEIKKPLRFLRLKNLSFEHSKDSTSSHSRLPSQIISEQDFLHILQRKILGHLNLGSQA